MRPPVALIFTILFSASSSMLTAAQTLPSSVIDPGVVTTRQNITPAGVQAVFSGRVHAIGFCGPRAELTVVTQESAMRAIDLVRFNILGNKVLSQTRLEQYDPGIQGLTCLPSNGDLLLSVTYRQNGKRQQAVVRLTKELVPSRHLEVGSNQDEGPRVGSEAWKNAAMLTGQLGSGVIGGLGLSADETVAVVALTGSDEVALLNIAKKRIERTIRTGIAPFTTVLDNGGTVAWVSNWGGRVPGKKDRTAPTGAADNADQVAIDARGIASSGTVSRIDLASGRVTDEINVGLHPTSLAWDKENNRLYVANGNSDSVSVIDTKSRSLIATWSIQPFTQNVKGTAPTALVLSPDGRHLYAACGGINAVAELDTSTGAVEGMIPTGWYPSDIALSPDGTTLAVSTLLGVGSGTNMSEATLKYLKQLQPDLQPAINRRYVHSYRGTLHVIQVPQNDQLAAYSRAVAENNHLKLRSQGVDNADVGERLNRKLPLVPLPVPVRQGDPSLIDHVVYIVKENRTYDQLFGDLGRGNGDPSLTLYGADVTPNHRKLANEFVLLDNFYATGGNSGDGHQWVTQSAESDYALWPGYGGRSYPFDGNDPIAYASSGFLWDAALKAGKTFVDFGEFIPEGQFAERANGNTSAEKTMRIGLLQKWKEGDAFIDHFKSSSPIPPLDAHLVRDFPAYGGEAPDVVRSRIFMRYLKQWEQSGKMPNLTYIQLPSDHTAGTSPGWSSPRSYVADNDLALGQIVEALTHSKFWPKMAIFVVEDDAQNGVDHVDGHRTVALLISPYIKRHAIDSTFYSHPSINKTIELMLGLPNLSLFDLIANDMRNSFTSTPDLTPYTAVDPKQSLFEMNPPASALKGQARRDALASARMNWLIPDAAPSEQLNRILWRKERGTNAKYPGLRQAVFAPYSAESDDDDR
jgi:YVTN family beta-propeller protein